MKLPIFRLDAAIFNGYFIDLLQNSLHAYRECVNFTKVIVSFGDRLTSDIYHGIYSSRVRRLPSNIIEPALYKLDLLNAAESLNDLVSPPGNRLEPLRGDYAGFHSIRINIQWRIVFQWEDSNAYEVKVVDYH